MPVIFLLQAEDGIRDLTVTGVQTCALPIFMRQRQTPKTMVNPMNPRESSRAVRSTNINVCQSSGGPADHASRHCCTRANPLQERPCRSQASRPSLRKMEWRIQNISNPQTPSRQLTQIGRAHV